MKRLTHRQKLEHFLKTKGLILTSFTSNRAYNRGINEGSYVSWSGQVRQAFLAEDNGIRKNICSWFSLKDIGRAKELELRTDRWGEYEVLVK